MIYFDLPDDLYLLFVGNNCNEFLNETTWGKPFAITISPDSAEEFSAGAVHYEGKLYILGLGKSTDMTILISSNYIASPNNPIMCRQKMVYALENNQSITVKLVDRNVYEIV